MSVVLPAPLGPMIACVSRDHIEIDPIVGQQAAEALAGPRIASSVSAIGGAIDREAEQARVREQHDEDQGAENDLASGGRADSTSSSNSNTIAPITGPNSVPILAQITMNMISPDGSSA